MERQGRLFPCGGVGRAADDTPTPPLPATPHPGIRKPGPMILEQANEEARRWIKKARGYGMKQQRDGGLEHPPPGALRRSSWASAAAEQSSGGLARTTLLAMLPWDGLGEKEAVESAR